MIWRLPRRIRAVVFVCAALALAGVAIMNIPPRPKHCREVLELELPFQVDEFSRVVAQCWQGGGSPTKGTDFAVRPLRVKLMADALLLVPAYVGLLCLFSVLLSRHLTDRGALLQIACVVPVLTGLSDWLENGLIMRGAEDVAAHLLTAEAIADIRAASLMKWFLLGLCSLQVAGLLAIWALRRDEATRMQNASTVGACIVLGLAGTLFVSSSGASFFLLNAGMVGLVLGAMTVVALLPVIAEPSHWEVGPREAASSASHPEPQ